MQTTVRRVAALNDIHGNLPALEAVLDEVERANPDLIVVGGDVAGGPMPAETLDRLIQLDREIAFVRGNGERELVRAFDRPRRDDDEPGKGRRQHRLRWTASKLTQRHRDFLAGFTDPIVIAVEGLGPVLFCHGSPRSEDEIITAVSSEERLRGILDGVEQQVIVCGHTHHQFDRRVAGRRVINAGSVGMPYEGTTGLAYWALLGPEVELRQTGYDFAAALQAIRSTGYPNREGLIADFERPPTAQEVAEYFESVALGQSV